jgi:hypothetical protein
MSESIRRCDHVEKGPLNPVDERVRAARAGLTTLLREAEHARRRRSEVAGVGNQAEAAVCAWNHFENIPTFYNWNNRPR